MDYLVDVDGKLVTDDTVYVEIGASGNPNACVLSLCSENQELSDIIAAWGKTPAVFSSQELGAPDYTITIGNDFIDIVGEVATPEIIEYTLPVVYYKTYNVQGVGDVKIIVMPDGKVMYFKNYDGGDEYGTGGAIVNNNEVVVEGGKEDWLGLYNLADEPKTLVTVTPNIDQADWPDGEYTLDYAGTTLHIANGKIADVQIVPYA